MHGASSRPHELGGALAAVAAHERVPAAVAGHHGQGDEDAARGDALREGLHLLVVGDAERVARELVDEADRDALHGARGGGVARLLGRE